MAHLKTVTVVDVASKQRVKLANDWGATVFDNLATCTKRWWLLGILGGVTRSDDSLFQDATAKIVKHHGDWLKLHNQFDCMGETIRIDDDVIDSISSACLT